MGEILTLSATLRDEGAAARAEYYRISPDYLVPIDAAVPAVMSIASIAESAERAYDALFRGFEYMPAAVSAFSQWSEVYAVAHALAAEAWLASGMRPSVPRLVRFPNQYAMVEALQCLAADSEVPVHVRQMTADFIRALDA